MSHRPRFLLLLVIGLVLFGGWSAVARADTITIDGNDPSTTTYDGIGYISAGAESRLLIDYPEPQRSQILDLLLCSPSPANQAVSGYCGSGTWGAAVQMLKVEIGGDTNSSVGSEASFLHSLAEYNTLQTAFQSGTLAQQQAACHLNRGYEWWLMREARKRNPNIKLNALAWGAPGWLDDGGGFYSVDTQQYLIDFAKCAAINGDSQISGTPLDYFSGAQNERSYSSTSWVINLKNSLVSQLSAAGIRVPKFVCCDNDWTQVVSDINTDPNFSNAIDVVGVHYQSGPPPQSVPQPTWASEDWVTNPPAWPPGIWPGAGELGQLFNENYLNAGNTGTLIVPLVDGYYNNLPSSGWGPILTYRPWSGNFTVEPALWVTAQYTQFTQPGWKYLNGASCFMGATGPGDCRTDRSLGSYVTLRNPASNDWSTIVETINATSSQNLVLCPVNLGTPASTLHVAMSDPAQSLQPPPGGDVPIGVDGCYHTTVEPDAVYSFSTLGFPTIQKGEPTPPADSSLPLPYFENFDGSTASLCPRAASYQPDDLPCWISDQEGSFAVQPNCGSNAYPGGSGGNCLEQVVDTPPIQFLGCHGIFNDSLPCNNLDLPHYWAHVGETNGSWTDYDVSVLFNSLQAGIVRLYARVSQQGDVSGPDVNASLPAGYEFDLNTNGQWAFGKRVQDPTDPNNNLEFVSFSQCHDSSCEIPVAVDSWHRLKLRVSGGSSTTITACLDNAQVASFTDNGTLNGPAYTAGQVGFATLGIQAEFDDLKVAPISGTACS